MTEDIIRRHNEIITMEDDWYFLGDLMMNMKHITLLSRLNFKRMIWIKGNHDVQLNKYLKRLEDDHREVIILHHHEMEIGAHKVNLCHFPYSGDSGYEDRFKERRLTDNGVTLLSGHSHRPPEKRISYTDKGTLQVDVGIDGHQMAPYNEKEIEELINANIR